MSRNLLLDPLVAVRVVVEAYNQSRHTSMKLNHAQETLRSALQTSESRAAFLQGLAVARKQEKLSETAYTRIMAATARLLRSQVDLVDECQRIVQSGSGRS